MKVGKPVRWIFWNANAVKQRKWIGFIYMTVWSAENACHFVGRIEGVPYFLFMSLWCHKNCQQQHIWIFYLKFAKNHEGSRRWHREHILARKYCLNCNNLKGRQQQLLSKTIQIDLFINAPFFLCQSQHSLLHQQPVALYNYS